MRFAAHAVSCSFLLWFGVGVGEACSPDYYSKPSQSIWMAYSTVESADWVAVGKVLSLEEVSLDEVAKRYELRNAADILTGAWPSSFHIYDVAEFKPVRYEFLIQDEIKGNAPEKAYVWSVDSADSVHPKKAIGSWDRSITIGSHGNGPDCSIYPSFEIGQEVLLVKRKWFSASDLAEEPDADIRAYLAQEFSRPAFRDLEPLEGNDDWLRVIKLHARLDGVR